MPSLISTDYPKSSDEFHVGSALFLWQAVSSSDILFFVAVVYISLSFSSCTHIAWARSPSWRVSDCRKTFSAIFYSLYSASVCWSCLLQCALHLHRAAAPLRVQRHFVIRDFCSFCVWTSPWPDRHQPWAVMDKKKDFKVADCWVTWHIHFLF